jgi:hypothetical protein
MPCVKLQSEVDLDAAFTEAGLMIGLHDGSDNPHRVLSWDELEAELIEFGEDNARTAEGWRQEWGIAMSLIAVGQNLKAKLMAMRPRHGEQC